MIKYIYIAILYIDLPVIYGQGGKKSWGPEGWAAGLGRRLALGRVGGPGWRPGLVGELCR